jgi:tyrosyl-tRNA synthetase
MSKSDPDSAIFMEDAAADVKRKIKKAYCPPQVVEANPIVDYAKNIVMGFHGKIDININGVSRFAHKSLLDRSNLRCLV